MKLMHEALESLARGEKRDLDAFFHMVQTKVSVGATSATCHFHCINLDGNGRPRINDLVKHLLEHVLDYSIPKKRISEAVTHYELTNSTSKISKLSTEAKTLFSKLANSGEGGELILFLLAERFLKLPQLICKMSLKTSTPMHFHGADGLHAGVDLDSGRLCLYWGESKLHQNVTGAVYECMKSIAPLLLGEGGVGSPEERDLQLLGQYLNVEDENLEKALKMFLDPDSPSFNKVEFRGLCLVGFDSEHYPKEPNNSTIAEVASVVASEISKWQGTVGKRIAVEKLESFSIHVFLMPFPSVEDFRINFKAALSGS
jgi:hypothetical protein